MKRSVEILRGSLAVQVSLRELQVLELLQGGRTNKEIALMLGISPYTVRDRISDMLIRYGLPKRAALAAWHAQRASVSASGWPTVDRRVTERRAR